MSSVAASSALLSIIDGATSLTVVSGERRTVDTQAMEPGRPYFRVSFVRMGSRTNVPGKKRGIAVVECFAKSQVEAWAKATELTDALGVHGLLAAPTKPNAVDSYTMDQAGWLRGSDPQDGGHCYCNLQFYYFD